MTDSHNLVITAQALVEITKQYLNEILSNEDWSSNFHEYVSKQTELVDILRNNSKETMTVRDKQILQEKFRVCYQLELQINHEISRQHKIVSSEINQLRKSNHFKNKYEMLASESGVMLDTYK